MAAAAGEEVLPPIVEGEYVHISDERHLPTSNGTSNFNLNKKASTLPDQHQGQSALIVEYDFTRDLIRPQSLSHGQGPTIEPEWQAPA